MSFPRGLPSGYKGRQSDNPLTMIRLSDLRHAGHRTALVWVLACLLVAQALFPIQAHTRFAVDAAGEVVQICTLQGAKAVVLDPVTGEQQPASHDDDGRSPACAFSLLLAAAVASAAASLPGWVGLTTVADTPILPRAPAAPILRHSLIRAPPALV